MYYDYSPYLHKFYRLMQMATLKLALHLTPSERKIMNTGVYIFDYATAMTIQTV